MIESLTDPSFAGDLMVAGVPVFAIPESAKRFPTFVAWWLAEGRLNPKDHGDWSTLSGPHLMRGRVELIRLDDWAALDPGERDRIREWARSLPIGIFYD